MKSFITIILTLFIAVVFVNNSVAQCDSPQWTLPLDNAGFEDWADEGGYVDPSPDANNGGAGLWDTPNRTAIINLLFDENVTADDSDPHSGNYSARLETTSSLGTLVAASLFTGEFEPNILMPLESVKFGKPFTERPDFFRVWYQYEPVQGDSAEIYCYIGKGIAEETRIASAYTKIYDATSGWTELVLPFEYVSSETPDSIIIVFAASAAGDDFEGQVGTTLHIDDVELVKCMFPVPTDDLLLEDFTTSVFPNPSQGGTIQFEFSQLADVVLDIFSVDGKKVFSTNVNGDNYPLDIVEWNDGFYQYVVKDKDSSQVVSRGSFVVQ